MHFWTGITALGDSAMLLPVALVLALWMLSALQYRLAGQWCLTVGVVGLTVSLSKLLFMAWCLGMPSLDFTGISGHTALAATVLPTLLHLAWQIVDRSANRAAWRLGVVLAILVGVSRLAIHVHSVSEVISGLVLGLTAARIFLRAMRRAAPVEVDGRLVGLSLMVLPCFLWLQPAPTQLLLEQIAILMTGQHAAYTRQAQTCDLPRQQIGHRMTLPAGGAMLSGAGRRRAS